MDFTLTEDQAALSELAQRILAEQLPAEQVKQVEAAGGWFAADVWAELAKADLLGLCLPEVDGGGGYDIFEACLLLTAVGRTVAPVPLLASLVLGAMPLAEFANAAQRAALLPGVIDGSRILTAALVEEGDALPPDVPETVAVPDGGGWRLHGTKVFVPSAHLASHLLVPARTGSGTGSTVFVVDAQSAGLTIEPQIMTNLEPMSVVRLEAVVVSADDVVGELDGGSTVVAWTFDRAIAGLCALQAGVCDGALRLAATYTSERQQFNAPIATFQAVAQRMADAYIDTEAIRLTALQAAWRLAEGEPADDALDIAKFWAAEGAQRVVHAAQHVHGGIGVDVDYPVHRYFRWAKQLELALGGGTRHLARVGARLAQDG